LDICSRMYALAALCAMGTHYLRLLHFLPRAVDGLLTMQSGQASPSALQVAFRRELLSWVRLHCCGSPAAGRRGGDGRKQRRGKAVDAE
jgi:hypothetical protein